MQALIVLALAVLAGTSGYLIKVPVAPILQPTLAPSGWVHLQKLVLPLFENVCEVSTDPVIVRLSQEFSSSLPAGEFWDSEVLAKFQTLKTGKGFLPKGQIFSEYNIEHTNELKIILNLMRNAKSFDTFYKIAAWSRQNLNCGLYVNLIYMALENRRDTEKLTLPPPYELLPNYFIRKDIIIQGSSLLAGEEFTPSEGVRDEGNAYTLDANYTANISDNDDESKLAYFREDIGLNSYYYLKMLKWAPWMNDNVNINGRYGEDMYHMMKQLVARYNLERYANGLPEQEDLNWNSLSDAPYDPMLVYSNGNEFIHRTSPVQLPENEDKALLQTIENNIATVVSHMRDAGYNKSQVLNHLMEILVSGERSYDSLARHLLGKALSNNGQPTVFEHYMTSLRDPLIWKMYKKMVALVDNALKTLPPYTKTELYFPGVEVISIDVKKMMTNFENFEFDITEALKIGNGDSTFQVKIGQSRLNHKPFTMKVNISSLVSQKGLVKIYLGPKMMPGEFAKKKNMFNLLDSFELNLKKGTNLVTRTSNDMKMFAPDFTSLKTLRKKVEDAEFGLDSLSLNTVESQINFPERLTIPKGTPEGLLLQLFVFVAPLMKATNSGVYTTPNLEFNSAVLSPLYPLDLMMVDRILLDLPNAMIKDITVTQKGTSGAGGAKKPWNGKPNGPPSRTNAYNNGNEPFDKTFTQQSEEDGVKFNSNGFSLPNPNFNYGNYEQNDDSYTEIKPSVLKTAGYDYSSSSKQPYDYKSKRPTYQKPDYSSKRIDYKSLYQNKTTEIPTESQNKETDKISMDNQVLDEIQEYSNAKDLYTVDQNSNELDYKVQDSEPSLGVRHYLLKSSGSNIVLDQKEIKDDEKYKRPKIVMPDYKKIFKNIWKTTENPINKKSKLVIMNEDKIKVSKNDKNIDYVPITENIKIFKLIQDENEPNSANNNNYILIEDEGNIEILKILNNNNNDADVSPGNLSDQNYKVLNNVKEDFDNGNYYDAFNGHNEESKNVVPVTESPYETTKTIYNYIMRV